MGRTPEFLQLLLSSLVPPRPFEGRSSATNDLQISYLSPPPHPPARCPPAPLFLPEFSAQRPGSNALVSRVAHQGEAQVSAMGLTHVLTVWPHVCPRPPRWGQRWNATDALAYAARKAQVLCFVIIVRVPVFTWPNTKRHCCTAACGDPEVSRFISTIYFCSASPAAHMLRRILLHPCSGGMISWLPFKRLWNHQVSFCRSGSWSNNTSPLRCSEREASSLWAQTPAPFGLGGAVVVLRSMPGQLLGFLCPWGSSLLADSRGKAAQARQSRMTQDPQTEKWLKPPSKTN